jgi:hypothetical protein
VVPRDGALGWRKTHFGHPDGHIGRHLAWALTWATTDLVIWTSQVPGWIASWESTEELDLRHLSRGPVLGHYPLLALLVHLLLL